MVLASLLFAAFHQGLHQGLSPFVAAASSCAVPGPDQAELHL